MFVCFCFILTSSGSRPQLNLPHTIFQNLILFRTYTQCYQYLITTKSEIMMNQLNFFVHTQLIETSIRLPHNLPDPMGYSQIDRCASLEVSPQSWCGQLQFFSVKTMVVKSVHCPQMGAWPGVWNIILFVCLFVCLFVYLSAAPDSSSFHSSNLPEPRPSQELLSF